MQGCNDFNSVREAEAVGLREAITMCMNLQLQRVMFESDAKEIVDAFHSNAEDISDFGTIIMDCIHLCKQVTNYSVTFIKRQANECAHRLAKAACSNVCFVVLN